MLFFSTSFRINTSIFSLSLFIVFHLIKGHTTIFNNLHFYTWKKKKLYKKKKKKKKNRCFQLDQSFWHFFFSALVTFRFFMEIIYASSYQIYIKSSRSNIRIWSLVVLSIFHFVFVLTVMIPLVCAYCVDVTLCVCKRGRDFSWSSNYYFEEEEDTLEKTVMLPHF